MTALIDRQGKVQQRQGRHRTGSLSQPHLCLDHPSQAQRQQNPLCPGFRRYMSRQHGIRRLGTKADGTEGRHIGNQPIQQHGQAHISPAQAQTA